MAQPALDSYLDTHQSRDEIYQTPTYAFVILYLIVGYYVAYLSFFRRGSGAPAFSHRFWNSFCTTITWPICKLIRICTISLKGQLSNDRGKGKTCDSSRWSPYNFTGVWKWMDTSIFNRKLWIPTQNYCHEGPPGLGNIDNSCYQNAVLQVFILPNTVATSS